LRQIYANLPEMRIVEDLGPYVKAIHEPRMVPLLPGLNYGCMRSAHYRIDPYRSWHSGTWLERAWFVNLAAATLAASFFFAVFIKPQASPDAPPVATPVHTSRVTGT
jgi:hypothetical protein